MTPAETYCAIIKFLRLGADIDAVRLAAHAVGSLKEGKALVEAITEEHYDWVQQDMANLKSNVSAVNI